MADYIGIDYSLGRSNYDIQTGIHYGKISLNYLHEWAIEHFEADYGDPTCPKCGNLAIETDSYREANFDFDAECGVWQCEDCYNVWYPMELDYDSRLEDPECGLCPKCHGETTSAEFERAPYGCGDYLCLACRYIFDSSEAFPEDPLDRTCEDNEYALSLDTYNDVWIFKSPYYTYAQYCSPCAPGAGHLSNPCRPDSGAPKTYCLEKNWYENDQAPYPYYSVETEELVYIPESR